MSAHLPNEIVERFHAQSMTAGDRSVIYTHILGCETCRRRVVTPQAEAVAVQTLTAHLLPTEDAEPYHLDLETMQSFVNDSLDVIDRNTVKLHLEDCAECSDEVTDLRESLATMKALSRQPNQRVQRSELASRRSFTVSVPMRIAAMIALIAFAAVVLIVVSRWRSSGPAQLPGREVATGSQPTPVASPQNPNQAPSPSLETSPSLAGNTPPKPSEEPHTTTLLAIKDGPNEIGLDQAGNVVGLPTLPAESRQAVKKALAGESLTRPDVLDEVASAQVSVRSSTGNEEPIIISDPSSSVIKETQPTLRWKPSKTAEGYRIEVADQTFHQIAKSDDLPATQQSWTTPVPLKRGELYRWTVRAINGGSEPSSSSSQGKFKVLEEGKVLQLNKLKASQSHLALGLFYAHEGMISDAEREFGILVKQNPNSTIAITLLKGVRSWRKR